MRKQKVSETITGLLDRIEGMLVGTEPVAIERVSQGSTFDSEIIAERRNELKYQSGKRRESRKNARNAQMLYDCLKSLDEIGKIDHGLPKEELIWLQTKLELREAQAKAHHRRILVRRAHEAWLEVVRSRY